MLIQKFVEVPNTNIQEEVLSDFGYDLCYDMAQQYGHAQLVWYALMVTEWWRVSIQTGTNLSHLSPIRAFVHTAVVGGSPPPPVY